MSDALDASSRMPTTRESALGAARRCLERIEKEESRVRAWAFVDPERAIAYARELDRMAPASDLHGVPVGVKDIFDTKDMPTEYGSPIYTGQRPRRDADVVSRLRAAGCLILGKTVTTEFATWHPGPTRNPHNLEHTPGGSSSGSAAAVASGMAPVAIGTQTVGSTIRPASFCGVVGFKPTYGSVSLAGCRQQSPSQDTVGFFATSVADAVRVGRALGVRCAPRQTRTGRWRLGWVRTPYWDQLHDDGREAIMRAVELAQAAGASVHELTLPAGFRRLLEAQMTVTEYEVARSFVDEVRKHPGQVSGELTELVEKGIRLTDDALEDAFAIRRECGQALTALFSSVQAILAPAATGEAPKGISSTGDATPARLWSLLGVPTISVPGMTGATGMPIGVQLVGPKGADATLVDAAAWLEGVLPPPARL